MVRNQEVARSIRVDSTDGEAAGAELSLAPKARRVRFAFSPPTAGDARWPSTRLVSETTRVRFPSPAPTALVVQWKYSALVRRKPRFDPVRELRLRKRCCGCYQALEGSFGLRQGSRARNSFCGRDRMVRWLPSKQILASSILAVRTTPRWWNWSTRWS